MCCCQEVKLATRSGYFIDICGQNLYTGDGWWLAGWLGNLIDICGQDLYTGDGWWLAGWLGNLIDICGQDLYTGDGWWLSGWLVVVRAVINGSSPSVNLCLRLRSSKRPADRNFIMTMTSVFIIWIDTLVFVQGFDQALESLAASLRGIRRLSIGQNFPSVKLRCVWKLVIY